MSTERENRGKKHLQDARNARFQTTGEQSEAPDLDNVKAEAVTKVADQPHARNYPGRPLPKADQE